MKTALSLADLNKRIDTINSSASKLMEDYQEVALLCLTHLKNHGDVGPVNRLQVGMPKGSRKLAMGVWFLKHGALVPNTDQGTRETMPLRYAKDRETDLDKAASVKWYDEVPERTINDVFDLKVAVQSLLNRAKGKKLKIGGEDKPHEAHSMLKMLAVGVGLANPFAAEEQAAAEAQAKEAAAKASATARDAVGAAAPATEPNEERPTVQRETRATAKGATKKAAKRGRRAMA